MNKKEFNKWVENYIKNNKLVLKNLSKFESTQNIKVINCLNCKKFIQINKNLTTCPCCNNLIKKEN